MKAKFGGPGRAVSQKNQRSTGDTCEAATHLHRPWKLVDQVISKSCEMQRLGTKLVDRTKVRKLLRQSGIFV